MTPPKMPIHIGDYKRDTGHLRAAEHGAYLLLLFHHWATGSLPDDDRQLASIACMSQAEWKRAKPILIKFFDQGWIHGRVLNDLKEANESYEKLAAAGSKGGKAKAERKRRASEASSEASQTLEAKSSDALPTDNRLPIKEDSRIDARASGSVFTEGSKARADAFLQTLGFEKPLQIPPEMSGTDWRALEWERAGYPIDLICSEARRVGPGKPLLYYEKCFATAFAKLHAPLPIVEIREAEKITVTHGKNGKSGDVSAACDKLVQLAHESYRRALSEDSLGDGTDQNIARLLPYGGS